MAEPEASAPSARPKNMGLIMVGLLSAMVLASMNQTVLAPAFPTMAGELGSTDAIVWVVALYLLGTTFAMPFYGKLSDYFNQKALLISAVVIFLVGSMLGALTPTIEPLLVGRALQGFGGGGQLIVAQAIVSTIVPLRDRGQYLALTNVIFVVASVLGPFLGGWLTEGPGWRWVFWIGLPVAAFSIAMTMVFVKLPPRESRQERLRLDIPGIVLLPLLTTGIVLIGSWGGSTFPWLSPPMLVLYGGTALVLVLFVLAERFAPDPMMPLMMFRDRNFLCATIATMCVTIPLFTGIGYLPVFFQMAGGVSALVAGVVLIPLMGLQITTAMLAGVYIARTGRYRALLIVSCIVVAASLVLLSTMTAETPLWLASIYIGLLGLGTGAPMNMTVVIAQSSFPQSMVGTVTGAFSYARQTGGALGTSIPGSIFAARLATLLQPHSDEIDEIGGLGALSPSLIAELPPSLHDAVVAAYTEALVPIFLWLAPLGLLGAVALLLARQRSLDEAPGAR